ncbi:hypothetical protein [Arthrobacter sp. UCD-GKA]|nr:hypothetical protein [Arthrobacter sp. UCD-GKA]
MAHQHQPGGCTCGAKTLTRTDHHEHVVTVLAPIILGGTNASDA